MAVSAAAAARRLVAGEAAVPVRHGDRVFHMTLMERFRSLKLRTSFVWR